MREASFAKAMIWLERAESAVDGGVQEPPEVIGQALIGIGYALLAIWQELPDSGQ